MLPWSSQVIKVTHAQECLLLSQLLTVFFGLSICCLSCLFNNVAVVAHAALEQPGEQL
jgi:hypothetical protein